MSDIQRMSIKRMVKESIDQHYPYMIIYDNKEYRYGNYGIDKFYYFGGGYDKSILEVVGNIEDNPMILYDQEIKLNSDEYQVLIV